MFTFGSFREGRYGGTMMDENPDKTVSRRVVSLWLPAFATDRLARRRGAGTAEPLATVTAAHGGSRIAAVSPTAGEAGVAPGLPLAEARALVPGLRTAPADPAAEARTLEAMAHWCGRYTPWVTIDGLEAGGAAGLLLDVSGCAPLFGGEDGLLGDLLSRLGRAGFHARAALADTAAAAWAAARFADSGNPAAPSAVIVPPGAARQTLAPLPVAALRLPPGTAERLRRVGLRRIGELLDLPRAPLAARYGPEVRERLDQALGTRGEALAALQPRPPHHSRLEFAEPIGTAASIAGAARRLLEAAAASLAAAGEGARRLVLVAFRSDGSAVRAETGTARPTRDAGHLARLLEERLECLDPGFGIEAMTLWVADTEPLAPAQADLAAGDGLSRGEPLDLLVDRLGNRLGADHVIRLEPFASHRPERACREVPALAPAPVPGPATTPSFRPARPLRLLPWPEPVEAVTSSPAAAPLSFSRGRHPHRIVRAEGPERIAPEWWTEGAPPDRQGVRDYYRVEDERGVRFWLFREGLPLPGTRPRWYLHGVFA